MTRATASESGSSRPRRVESLSGQLERRSACVGVQSAFHAVRRGPPQQRGVARAGRHRVPLLGERLELGPRPGVEVELHGQRRASTGSGRPSRAAAVRASAQRRSSMVSSRTSFHCCGVQTRLSVAACCCGGQPGQVLLTPGERDRLGRAGQHLVPLRVGPAVAGPGEQQVDPLRAVPSGVAPMGLDRGRDQLLGLHPARTYAGPGRRRRRRRARPVAAYDGPAASQCREPARPPAPRARPGRPLRLRPRARAPPGRAAARAARASWWRRPRRG